VSILLGREEVSPEEANNEGITPHSWAAWEGHKEVMKVLLVREEVNPDQPNNCGQTPL